MSMDKSLKRDKFSGVRNVRKRYERLQKLIRTGKFIDGLSVFGLPKEKIRRLKIKVEKEKKKEGLIPLDNTGQEDTTKKI